MAELRFHYHLYSRPAIEGTIAAFAEHGQISLRDDPPYFVVELQVPAGADQDQLSGEFANYTLGLTVEERRVRT